MSLTLAFDIARSGLRAAQGAASGTSENIANASTPGYARQDPTARQIVFGGSGQGATVDLVRARTDGMLLRDLRFGAADLARHEAQAAALARYTEAIGQPQDERSLAADLGRFENALQNAAAQPASNVALRGVRDAADAVVAKFATLSAEVRAEREAADREIAAGAARVNGNLEAIEGLNRDIKRFSAAGRNTAALEDERARRLDDLARDLPIRTYEREDGETVVLTRGGTTLLDGEASRVDFTPVGAIPADMRYPADSPPLGGLTVDGVDIAPGSGSPAAIGAGRLAGLFEIRDTLMPREQDRLDAAAAQLAAAFEAADATVPGGGVTGLFVDGAAPAAAVATAPPPEGLAARLAVNPNADPDQGGSLARLRDGMHAAAAGPVGDATQLLAFGDALRGDRPFDPGLGLGGDRTVSDFAAAAFAAAHQARAGAERAATGAGAAQTVMETARTDATGVNIDREMQRLLEIEKAYAASANVLEAVNRMFDEILRLR